MRDQLDCTNCHAGGHGFESRTPRQSQGPQARELAALSFSASGAETPCSICAPSSSTPATSTTGRRATTFPSFTDTFKQPTDSHSADQGSVV